METVPQEPQEPDWLCYARELLSLEAHSIQRVAQRLDRSFLQALELLDHCEGKVITTGVGKSGIAARKLAATLTSIGCAAVFLHPAEALHGDLGLVQTGDVVIALSNGGESEELLAILPALQAREVPIVAIVGNISSTLARKATLVLDASIEREACPLNLAPTTSVVVSIALGDALAMTLEKRRGFRPEDYARNHPGGRLGRRLTLKVRDLMHSDPAVRPAVSPDTLFMEILNEISAKCLGATCVTDEENHLLGIITDHDTRRALQKYGNAAIELTAERIMTARPAVVLKPDQLAYDALRQMEERPRAISVAPVVDEENHYIGMVRVHDLVRAGL
ncbi:MAG: KpsF/GutQ family sugar-phosphate isomerase [Chloroherpetonaceae bacterium]|nr:KpsF/GutQ family sugar-phosphate isomerase [Chthonomonadaceae bacterium]MDW8206703.1 KpsF/GutQ family sugar-phosphate isomerase [Chloroherpetonaceae bacterium]